jgi:hypothetical protein
MQNAKSGIADLHKLTDTHLRKSPDSRKNRNGNPGLFIAEWTPIAAALKAANELNLTWF